MKVLVVDDSLMAQKNMARLLSEAIPMAQIFVERDGEAAYERYCTVWPDLILVDLLMPRMNGFELLEKLRHLEHQAITVVVSADIQKSVQQEVLALGAKAFLDKPFTKEKAEYIASLMREMGYAD